MRRRAWVIAAVLLGCLTGAAPASAGTYDVVSCGASGANGQNRSWAYELGDLRPLRPGDPNVPEARPENFRFDGGCAGGLQAGSAPGPPQRTTGYGTSAALAFTAPGGTGIVGATLSRYGEASPQSQGGNWEVFAQNGGDGTAIGSDFLGDSCKEQGSTCTVGSRGGTSRSYRFAPTPKIRFGVQCGGPDLGNCDTNDGGSGARATFFLYAAAVTIEDPRAPEDLTVGGPATGEGWHRRSEPLVLGARDASGIRRIAVAVDGAPFTELERPCDFLRPRPCGDVDDLPVTLEGGAFAVADGSHQVDLHFVDAAGNRATATRTVRIDENGPELAVRQARGRTVTVDAVDRASGLAGAQIETRPLSGGAYAPIETRIEGGRIVGRVASGSAAGLGLRITARDVAGNVSVVEGAPSRLALGRALVGRRARSVRGGRLRAGARSPLTLRGTLRAADGSPLAGRRVEASAALRRAGATAAPAGGATTDASGRFSLPLPPGPSRQIRLAYGGDGGNLPSAKGVSVRVPAATTIRASRRVVSGRTRVTFSGRLSLAGQPVPRSGKLVEIQGKTGRRYQVIASGRARGSRARWRASYTFRGTRPGTFRLRARIRRESAFPFELGYSRTITVRVR